MKKLLILLGLTLTIIVVSKNAELSKRLTNIQNNIYFKSCLDSAYSQDQINLCTKLHTN